MNLNEYMNRGISLLLKTAGRYYFNNPRGIAFLAKTVPEIKKTPSAGSGTKKQAFMCRLS